MHAMIYKEICFAKVEGSRVKHTRKEIVVSLIGFIYISGFKVEQHLYKVVHFFGTLGIASSKA